MGKKSRRKAKLRAAARMAQKSPVQPVQQARPMEAPIAKPMVQTKAAVPSIQSETTLADRYQYVVPELRQIAIIAGSLLVILLILALMLH